MRRLLLITQGGLSDAGNPANGNYEVQFKLIDALMAGAQITP